MKPKILLRRFTPKDSMSVNQANSLCGDMRGGEKTLLLLLGIYFREEGLQAFVQSMMDRGETGMLNGPCHKGL